MDSKIVRPAPNLPAEIYLDEIVSILRSMEITQEQMEETMNCLLWQAMPFWRRWLARWRNARAVIETTEQEGADEPPELRPMRFD
jgi:hypothetical protein